MTYLQISEYNLLKMIKDLKNMKREFNCSYLDCDLNEDRIILIGQSELEDEDDQSPSIRIEHLYLRGGHGPGLSVDRKVEIRKQFGSEPSASWVKLQTDSKWQEWLELSKTSPTKKEKPKESYWRRVDVQDLLNALETIALVVSNSEAPEVKIIEFEIDGGFLISIKCAEEMDYLWFGGHGNVKDPDVDIYDKRFSASANISV